LYLSIGDVIREQQLIEISYLASLFVIKRDHVSDVSKNKFRNDGLYDEKFGDTDIEKGPETSIGPGIYLCMFVCLY
jgi:hypothetical protein